MWESFKKFNDGFGKIATVSGLLLIPFFGASAASLLAAKGAAATTGQVLTSFWSPLVTNHISGDMGVMPGITNMFNGWSGLAHGMVNLVSAALDPERTVAEAWAAPMLAAA